MLTGRPDNEPRPPKNAYDFVSIMLFHTFVLQVIMEKRMNQSSEENFSGCTNE